MAAWRFRPRVLPVFATVLGLSLVVLIAVVVAKVENKSEYTLFQAVTLAVFGAAILWILYRMATLRIVAYDDSLQVRNVFRSYRLDWSRIKALRFSPGDPWLQLFDADGNRLGVLAIQSADGSRARTAAAELAELAKAHGAG
jgi:hypothetical protein